MKNNFFKVSLIALAVLPLSSCLKDKNNDNFSNHSARYDGTGQKIVSIALRTDVTENVSTVAFNALSAPTVYDFVPITLSGGIPAEQDVHIVVELDSNIVVNYNTLHPGAFQIPVDTTYTILSKNITIPKGQSKAFVQIRITPSGFLGATWGLGFKIVSVDGGYTLAGGGKDKGLAGFAIKNKYDGNYTLKIRTTGWAAYGISDNVTNILSPDMGMQTTGATSLIYTHPATGSSQPAFTPSGGLTAFGATQPQFTFDGATDKLTDVVNLIPNDGRNRRFALNTDITDSRYDPTSQVIYAAYVMTQNGRPTQFIYDTLTYTGPR